MIKRVYLEITDACNLRCPFCTQEKGSSFLSFEDVSSFLKEIREVTSYIYLHILGEPLLHPRFEEILGLLDEMDFRLQLVTNATLLDRYPDLFSHPCLRKCSLSLHALNDCPERGKVLDHVRKLIEMKRDAVLEPRFYDRSNLQGDLQAFYAELEKTYGFSSTKRKNSLQIRENTYLYEEELFRWPDPEDPVLSEYGRCHAEEMLAVNVRGDVTLCCLDPKAHNRLGNLHEKSLREIVSSKDYEEALESLRGNRKLSDLCSRCSYRLRFR